MWRQPKALPQQPFDTNVFADGRADRPKVEGTVAWGKNRDGDPRYTAYKDGKLVTTLPSELVINGETLSTADPAGLRKVLGRGKERFEIFCTPCHGALGDGKGMITQRGLAVRRTPASYHTDRLRKIPIGHFFDVITNGAGVMFPYGARIDADDRWAIAAYIRALQKSQNAKASDLTPEQIQAIESAKTDKVGENHE
ncbi:MAG: cytochrome c [Armatimonadetes bacterium]|nr:cytochrome c [Armatimonadota bacterium]